MFVEKAISPKSEVKKKKRKSNNFSFVELDLSENTTPKGSEKHAKNKTPKSKEKISKTPKSHKKKEKMMKEKSPKKVEKSPKMEKSSRKQKRKIEEAKEENAVDYMKMLIADKDDLDEFGGKNFNKVC